MAEYTIHGQTLQSASSAKYLGLTIDTKLTWKHHMDRVTKKANSTRGFLQRNLRGCPQAIKAQAYTTFVRPTVEYASTIWDSHTQVGINKVEAVQRRAARFVKGDYRQTSSVTTMLQSLQWQTLQHRRQVNKVVMFKRILTGSVAIPAQLFTPCTVTTRGNPHKFIQPPARIQAYQYSFVPSAVQLWNQLPNTVACLPSADALRAALQAASFPPF